MDLLPTDISEQRVRDYVVKEVRKIGGWKEEEDKSGKKWGRVDDSKGDDTGKSSEADGGWESTIESRDSRPFRGMREYGKGYYSRLRKEKLSYEEGEVLREDVKLVSCQTGYGVDALLKRLLEVSKEHGCNTIHVLGKYVVCLSIDIVYIVYLYISFTFVQPTRLTDTNYCLHMLYRRC
ncbi:hypothetical protein EON65_50085 [archaeon]|nr:MAG: hypothetical protein EON65_50085 [archaeon]